jgi:hypothetical protein
MTEQIYKGPPPHMRLHSTGEEGAGWKYHDVGVEGVSKKHPLYVLWGLTEKDEFGYNYPRKKVSLWWNGARWVAWVKGVFDIQDTEFKDINDPPTDWAEGVYTLANE